MRRAGQRGRIVTVIADSGWRYAGTFGDDAWVRDQGWDVAAELEKLLDNAA